MHFEVLFHIGADGELASTKRAHVRFEAIVDSHMHGQVRFLSKGFLTGWTRKRSSVFDTGIMRVQVKLEGGVSLEDFAAILKIAHKQSGVRGLGFFFHRSFFFYRFLYIFWHRGRHFGLVMGLDVTLQSCPS